MTRLAAIVIVIVAIVAIVFGRVGHVLPVAVVGYVLLAVAIVVGLISRR